MTCRNRVGTPARRTLDYDIRGQAGLNTTTGVASGYRVHPSQAWVLNTPAGTSGAEGGFFCNKGGVGCVYMQWNGEKCERVGIKVCKRIFKEQYNEKVSDFCDSGVDGPGRRLSESGG